MLQPRPLVPRSGTSPLGLGESAQKKSLRMKRNEDEEEQFRHTRGSSPLQLDQNVGVKTVSTHYQLLAGA